MKAQPTLTNYGKKSTNGGLSVNELTHDQIKMAFEALGKERSRLAQSISELIDHFEKRTGVCVKNIYLNKTDISTQDKKDFLNFVDVEIDFRKK